MAIAASRTTKLFLAAVAIVTLVVLCQESWSRDAAPAYYDKTSFSKFKSDFEDTAKILEKHRSITFATPVRIKLNSNDYRRNSIESNDWIDDDSKKVDIHKLLSKQGLSEPEFNTLLSTLNKLWCAVSCSEKVKKGEPYSVMFFPANEQPLTGKVGRVMYVSGKASPEFFSPKLFKATALAEKWYLVEPSQ